jgi:hypothetical protein
MAATHQQPAKTPLRALPVGRHRDDVLQLEVIQQETIDRTVHALREVILEPGAVQPAHALVPAVLAGQKYDRTVPRKQLDHVLGTVEVDVVAVGPMQAADGVQVFELADAMLELANRASRSGMALVRASVARHANRC